MQRKEKRVVVIKKHAANDEEEHFVCLHRKFQPEPNGTGVCYNARKEKIASYSAGSKPSGKINPKAIATMKESGYDLSTHRSKSLAEIPDIEYDYVVTMGCGDECPFVKACHHEDWDIPDPREMNEEDFKNVRNLIEQKVISLLDGLDQDPMFEK